jgi:filamentous hemagglutinin
VTAPHHPAIRLLALFLTGALFFSSGPVLLAQSARSIMSPAGGGAGGGRGAAANLQNAGAASASLTATRAREALQKSEAALAAMKALQLNARSLMSPPEMPNGLAEGGLHPYDGFNEDGSANTTSWSGAKISSAKDSATVVIKQSLQNAFLYWNKFNVGSKTTVRFDQSAGGQDAGKWIAFNKVMGSTDPSHIYGSILAEGQVYILNQNGIIFHNGSQVNTHALVASTLPINENLAGDALKGIKGRGIANNPDSQFLFSALKIPGNSTKKTDTFTPEVTGPVGDVVVERGAVLGAPVNQNNTGGMVALVGANVRNEGTISTPNGQTILASGLQVGLTPHNAADPSLRGMDVTIGRVTDPNKVVGTVSENAGTTRNDGLLSVFRGNATMAGKEILQNGGIESSTSVDLNGRIDLMASYNAVPNPQFGVIGDALIRDYTQPNTGSVLMGPGSVLRILPEWESSKSIPGTSLALSSLVTVSGRNIGLGEGSILLAPGAVANSGVLSQTGAELKDGVTLQAGRWTDKGGSQSIFTRDVGRIDLARDASINAAGSTGVWVDSSRNYLKLQLRGAELADSPLQRNDQNIRGIDLVIDSSLRGTYEGRSWVGTPLGDVAGFVGLIDRTVGELTTAGGSISLAAGDAVSTATGSSVDVSGGWIRYSGGYASTTKLLYQGHLIDISQATPDRVYAGILTGGDKTILGKTFKDAGAATIEQSSKWGQVKVFKSILDPTRAVWHDAYVSGAPGGSISINAPSVALDGDLLGNTVAGPRQLRDYASLPGMNQTVLSTLPVASTLSLDLAKDSGKGILLSPYAPNVVFAQTPVKGEAVSFTIGEDGLANSLPVERAGSVVLSSDLVSTRGFGKLNVSSRDGNIVLPSGVVLDAGPNGSVSLQGANLSIGGGIVAPGGSVSLQAFLTPLSLANVILPEILPASVSGIMTLTEDVGILRRGEKVIVLGDPAAGDVTVYRADGTHAVINGSMLDQLPSGRVMIGAGARIDAAGMVSNDLHDHSPRPILLNGGSVSISGYDVSLATGASVDVSGGYRQSLLRGGAASAYGDAGSISISAGQDVTFPTIHRGSLALGGTLSGYAGVGSLGGSLALKAPAFCISRDGAPGDESGVNQLSAAFFDTGGFSSFSLTGVGLETDQADAFLAGVSVASGTILLPRVQSQVFTALGRGLILPQGPLASAPSLTLAATGLSDESRVPGEKMLIRGAVDVATGASIILNPQLILSESFPSYRAGALELHAPVVSFAGSASVPGGVISLTANGRYPSNDDQPASAQVTLDLAPSASLSVAGASLLSRDPLAVRQAYGAVLPGGSVKLSGNILARGGSVIDASGASSTLDLLPYQLGIDRKGGVRAMLSSGVVSRQVDSSGGSISLNGKQALRSDASLVARSGGKTANGGSLSISSGRFDDKKTPFLQTDLGLVISQSGAVIPEDFAPADQSAAGFDFENVDGVASGGGHVAVSSFASGGFQNLTLGGNVLFSGPVTISVPGLLKVATEGVLSADDRTELSATAAVMGTPFLAPLAPNDPRRIAALDPNSPDFFAPPTWGSGELVVKASRIDIGNLSLQGIGKAGFHAAGGSIRGDGNLVMAGDLTLQAAMIYPASGTMFRAVAFNHDGDGNAVDGNSASDDMTRGSITVLPGGAVPLPLSALGSISLQADTILQAGILAAPFGKITLGRSSGDSGSPDPLSGLNAPVTSKITMAAGGVTTVSGIDRTTGLGITVPFGTSADGTSWIDPSGTAITGTGLSGKSVSLSGSDLVMQAGSVVDIRGGGAITAKQWVSGLGGTRDILNDASGSWAIVPGYSDFIPPKGYAEEMVPVGTRIVLKQGAAGLAPGTYTLLPASYATQPGAYLLSRSSLHGNSSAFVKPDGTAVVPGTLLTGLDSSVQTPQITTLFELSSPGVIASKSDYRILRADTFFSRLPSSGRTADGGLLQLTATTAMNLAGSVASAAGPGGRAAAIDVAATAPVLVTGSGGPSEEPSPGTIVLDAAVLSSWKAGSLLLGGTRSITSAGEIAVNPVSENITLDQGTRLEGAEVILAAAPRTHVVRAGETVASIAESLGGGVSEEDLRAANQLAAGAELTTGQILKIPGSHGSVRLSDGASVVSSGGAAASTLVLQGNGALLRVGHADGVVKRTGFDPNATGIDGATPLASLVIGQDVLISGPGVTFDSTSDTTVDPLAAVSASSLKLSAGRISVNGEDPGALALSGTLLQGLNSSLTLKSLSLTSYSTMILHDGSILGSDNLGALSIRAAAIAGDGGTASLRARSMIVENGSGSSLPSSYAAPEMIGGSLEITADTLSLGNGQLRIDGFQTVSATARKGVSLGGKGGLTVGADLVVKAPVIAGLGGALTGINAGGSMTFERQGTDPGVLKPGLGATLSFTGSTVTAAIPVLAPSGSISIGSTSGDLTLSALLDVGGTANKFPGVIKYSDAGVISLSSQGDIRLASGSDLNLSAQSAAGSAGTLRLTAPNGTLITEGIPFRATGGKGGKAGSFLADFFGYNAGDLNPLQVILKKAGFTEKQDLRIRNGDVTIADASARSFRLSADSGSVTVTGTIDASGKTGGSIGLFAGQSVILDNGAVLDVRGEQLDAAGKGGLIDLEAGSSPTAIIAPEGRTETGVAFSSGESVIDLKSGSTLRLGVGGNEAGTLILKAPQTADATDLQIQPIGSRIENAGSIIAVGNNRIDVAGEGAVSIDPLRKYDEVAVPLPGQSVIGEDGGAYKLTMDAGLYAQFVAGQVAPGEIADPASSPYWTRIAAVWDAEASYGAGAKVVGSDGLIYTATASYPSDGTKPEPGTEEGASAWVLASDEGNYKALALHNASIFDAATLAAARRNFAGDYADRIHLRPGEEIINSSGGLLLNSDWDLSLARYGEKLVVLDAKGDPVSWSGTGPTDATETYQMIGREPGLLSLRAAGDVVFHGSLSDGFGNSIDPAAEVDFSRGLNYAPLIPLLATRVTDEGTASGLVRQDSWSYRISAGADFSSALPDSFSGGEGDIVIGLPGNPLPASSTGASLTSDIISRSGQYQVIRTGTGDISLSAARDVQLLSPFASVYTAGALVTDPTLGGRFDLPVIDLDRHGNYGLGSLDTPYPVQYASGGGNIAMQAGRDITRLNALLDGDGQFQFDESGNLRLTADSSLQLPSNWLLRRGAVDPVTGLFDMREGEVLSTSWWVDYSNFFQDVGALGGGNVMMTAGRDVANVSASIPTTYRMAGRDADGNVLAPDAANAVELGGGDLSVKAANNIDAGVYYVERGTGSLKAGGAIITNPTRDPAMPAVNGQDASAAEAWLPTTLFLGKGSFSVQAGGDLRLGPLANVFLTPQDANNSLWYKTYFSTYAPYSSVSALSLAGNLSLVSSGATELDPYPHSLLRLWYDQQLGQTGINSSIASYYMPWIRSLEFQAPSLESQLSLASPNVDATSLGGDITLQGNLTTAPAPKGDISLIAAGGINGLASVGSYNGGTVWMSSSVNLSDAAPANVPGVSSPLSKRSTLSGDAKDSLNANATDSGGAYFTDGISALFAESGSYAGNRALIETKQTLHDSTLLHGDDAVPLRFIASGGDISGLTLYSAKRAEVVASGDISDVGLYLQNLNKSDISLVSAGGSFRGYDPASSLRAAAVSSSLLANNDSYAQSAFPSGDLQISGPGTLELLAGHDIDLGNAPVYAGDATIWVGLTSIGNARNPGLPFQGADIVGGAGMKLPGGLSTTPDGLGLSEFTAKVIKGEEGATYLSELEATMTYAGHPFPKRLTPASFDPGSTDLTDEEKALAQLQLFYIVLRDTGRNYNKPESPGYRSYVTGEQAIAALFPNPVSGNIKAWARDIRTKNGGNISLFAPGGGLSLASISTGSSLTPPGIITESGGGINIFTRNSVDIGIGRIFTLRGGDIAIWSDKGDIAAGFSAKTVASAPPTRVLIDPQSGDVVTDLAGLSTGGGIGVLATVEGIPPGNVDLIAPTGVIDAGDAGIRSTGNLNLAATRVLNANNISAGGSTSGAPPAPPPPAAPNVSGATAASSASAANNASAQASSKPPAEQAKDEAPSIISVDVLGYGGGDGTEEEESQKSAGGGTLPTQASL